MSLFIAELLGTFVLFFLGTCAYATARFAGSLQKMGGRIGIAVAWGLGWAVAIYMVDRISEAHINPAVTFGYAVIGKVAWIQVPYYLGGQVVGSFLGALCAFLLFLPKWSSIPPKHDRLPLFATHSTEGKPGNHLIAQLLPSALFLMGMLAVRDTGISGMAPFLIGLVVLALYAACGTAPGFSINPARDLGSRACYCLVFPRKGGGRWRSAFLPIFVPIAGGILGALTYQAFLTLAH